MPRYIKAEQGLKHSVIYTDESGRYFRFSGGNWIWRNNNPGNRRISYHKLTHYCIEHLLLLDAGTALI